MEFFASMMREELSLVVKSFEKASSSKRIVDLSEAVHKLMEDIAFKMNFGSHTGKDTEFNYKKLVRGGMNLVGAFNVSDYLPCLRPFDLQRSGSEGTSLSTRFDWELPYGIKYEELDMEEKYAFPTPRARHLLAIPSRRLPN
ncbi:hypothetical protein K1719_013034 [Acacia pycnantha]|nr:hypothetical protein K1719_013034 [Acacia pycnantha]